MNKGLPLNRLFCYTPGTTCIHRFPAPIKLILLFVLPTLSFKADLLFIIAVFAFLSLLSLLAGIAARSFRSLGTFVVSYAVIMMLFKFPLSAESRQHFGAEMQGSALYLFKLATALLAGTLFYETTSGRDIRRAIDLPHRLLIRLHPAFSRLENLSFYLSLTITFIPRILDAWYALDLSFRARGGRSAKGPLSLVRTTIHRYRKLLPLLLLQLLDMASTTDKAIQNRR